MEKDEYIESLKVHPTACNQKEIERLTVVESPDQVHARVLRMAAEAAEEGWNEMVLEICQNVIDEIKSTLPHWE